MDVPIYLGHGASRGPESMAPYVEALRRRGVEAHALSLPRGRAEAAVGALVAQVADTGRVVVGGHSFGGRVASLAVAGPLADAAAGLVCLSFPLHRPGAPETWEARVAHWPAVRCPTLLLSGDADPFARIAFLRRAVRLLPDAELVTYPGVGHGLLPVIDDVIERILAFLDERVRPVSGTAGSRHH